MAVMAVMALWAPYIHPLCVFGIEMLSTSSESNSKKCSLVYYKCKCSPHTYKTKQQNRKKTYTEREKTYTQKQRTDTGSAFQTGSANEKGGRAYEQKKQSLLRETYLNRHSVPT